MSLNNFCQNMLHLLKQLNLVRILTKIKRFDKKKGYIILR